MYYAIFVSQGFLNCLFNYFFFNRPSYIVESIIFDIEVNEVSEIIKSFVLAGIDITMNQFNKIGRLGVRG